MAERSRTQLSAAASVQVKTGKGEVNKNWIKWNIKRQNAVGANFFNTDSPKQLCWLFYDELNYKVMSRTPKGGPSVAAEVLPFLDEAGRILMKYRKVRDERKFLTSLLNVQRDGVLYPNFKIPGTNTGRLSGGIEK